MSLAERLRQFALEELPELGSQILVALIILIVAWILAGFAGRLVKRTLQARRGGTLVPVARAVVKVVVMAIGVVVALDQLGINVAALLAGFGILGLAVGFGAQSLVKDVISGFFLLFDDVLRVGDVADVGPATGSVEEIGLRLTLIRGLNGQLWYVPNGEIVSVGNYNRTWTRAIAQVGLAYEGDVPRALEVLREVGEAYAAERPDLVLEPPEVQGVLSLADSSVNVRMLVKVKAQEHWGVERELHLRIKQAFDAAGVEIPFPRQVVYVRNEEAESAQGEEAA